MSTAIQPDAKKRTEQSGKPTNGSSGAQAEADFPITLDVPPRQPRLAWQGMERRELAESVPSQVVEVVYPGKAVATDGKLPGCAEARRLERAGAKEHSTAAQQTSRDPELPPNRLIWTNDNIVALKTLLDERDDKTRDYRYRAKIDLVYIDPPFMVNSDFLADNAIDLSLGDDEGVQAKKEPSLVEILAYKDTWRQGLDSFLSMLRERLVLLKDLLAPTGSIFVHLDWHVVHYVKVLMDEVFGYNCFRTEIVWRYRRWPAKTRNLQRMHDTILYYRAVPNEEPRFNVLYEELAQSTQKTFGTKKQVADFSSGHRKPSQVEEETPGSPLSDVWEISVIAPIGHERVGFPTQKPLALVQRIIRVATNPGDTVLDCFSGSGTTAEAAERLDRRWIGIDNAKYAMHLTRKRLIQLHGQPKPPEKQYDYVECPKCNNIERKEKPQKARELFNVRPFTIENMGVYHRAEPWQDFEKHRSRYPDEMVKVFGGEVINHSPLLHGRKGSSWVHIGPLDGPVSVEQVWSIARDAQRTDMKAVTVLAADFDTLSGSEKDEIKEATGVAVTVRIIPKSAVDEVKRRLELLCANPDTPVESMAIPAFYAPLSIVLDCRVSGRIAKVTLERCEVDIESFIASQRPMLKPIKPSMTAAAKKKAEAKMDKWETRQKELKQWLAKANTWHKFVDFWAVDWDYRSRVDAADRPIFETDWQSFRDRKGKGEAEPLVLTAEYEYSEPGHYQIAARVTDVFANDGIATVTAEVK